MQKRKKLSKNTQEGVLILCGRICGFCFGLKHDATPKQGQIAHLDHDSTNDNPDNLMWMCLDHHDQYDSTMSQSKSLTIGEARRYRDDVWAYKKRAPRNEALAFVRNLIECYQKFFEYTLKKDVELAIDHDLEYMGWLDGLCSDLSRYELNTYDIPCRNEFSDLKEKFTSLAEILRRDEYICTESRRKFDNRYDETRDVQGLLIKYKEEVKELMSEIRLIWQRLLSYSVEV